MISIQLVHDFIEINRDIFKDFGDEYKCKLCKQFVINPQINGCGCFYCLKCVDNFSMESGNCPGVHEECKINSLSSKTVVPDLRLNRQINDLIIKCPGDSCQYESDLKHVAEHFKITKCPFVELGCTSDNQNILCYIEKHLKENIYSHSNLIISYSKNIQNEFQSKVEYLEEKNKDLLFQLQLKDNEISHMHLALENNVTKSEENSNIIVSLLEKINTLEIDLVNFKGQVIQNEAQTKEKVIAIDKEIEDMKLNFAQTKDIVSRNEIELKNTKEKIENMQDIILEYCPYIWKIDDIFTKRQKAKEGIDTVIICRPFYSHKNGYKLRLSIDPNGTENDGEGTHLSIYLEIMRSNNDLLLKWPCILNFCVSILNIETGKSFLKEQMSYKCAPDDLKFSFDQPREEVNEGYGYGKFISWAEIEKNKNKIVTIENSIFVMCHIEN